MTLKELEEHGFCVRPEFRPSALTFDHTRCEIAGVSVYSDDWMLLAKKLFPYEIMIHRPENYSRASLFTKTIWTTRLYRQISGYDLNGFWISINRRNSFEIRFTDDQDAVFIKLMHS